MAEVILRGNTWEIVDVVWCRAEPDVGIMSAYVERYDLRNIETGDNWNWDSEEGLTEEEATMLEEVLYQMLYEDIGED